MSWWGADSSTPQLAAGTGVSTGAHIKSPINIITDHVFTVLKPFLISTTMQYVAGQGSDQSLLVMRSYGDCEIPENDEVPTLIGYDTTAMVDDYGIQIDGGPAKDDLVRSMATSPGNNVNFGRIIKEGGLPYTSDVRAGKGTKITPYGVDGYTDPKTGKTYPAKGKADSKVKKPKITIHVGAGLTFDSGSASDPLTGQAVIVHADLTKGLEFVADPNDTTSTALATKVDHKTVFFDSTGAITTDGSGGDSGAGGSGATPFPGKAIEILPTYGPADAPIVSVSAGAGVTAGTYSYASAYTVGDAISELGPASTVTTSADNGQVSVGVHAVPLPAPDHQNKSTATGQNLYRSDDGGKTWKLVMSWGDTDAHYIADTAAPTTVYTKTIDTINVELAVVGGVNVSALQTNAGDDKNGLTIKLACCDSPADTQDGSWDSGDAPDWGSFDFGSGWSGGGSGDPSDLGQAYWFNQGVFDAQNGNPRRTVTGNDLDNQAYQDGYNSTIALLGGGAGGGAAQGGRGFPIPELANPWDSAMATSGSGGGSSSGGIDIQGGATTCTKPCSGLTLSGGSNHGLAINLACGTDVPCDTSSSSGGASGGGAGGQGGAGQSFLALANPWTRATATSGSGGGTCDNISGLRIDGGNDANGLMIMLKPLSGMCIDKTGLGNEVDDITIKIDPVTNKMYAVGGGGGGTDVDTDDDSGCATCLTEPPPTVTPPGDMPPGTECVDSTDPNTGVVTTICTPPTTTDPYPQPPTIPNPAAPPGTTPAPDKPGFQCDGSPTVQLPLGSFAVHTINGGTPPPLVSGSSGFLSQSQDNKDITVTMDMHQENSGNWLQGHISATLQGIPGYWIAVDAGGAYDTQRAYNEIGLYYDGVTWQHKSDQSVYTPTSLQPGDDTYWALYIDCHGIVHSYLGPSADEFTEVGSTSYLVTGAIDYNWRCNMFASYNDGVIRTFATISEIVAFNGIPAGVTIHNINGSGSTYTGTGDAPNPLSTGTTTGTQTTTQNPAEVFGNLNVNGNLFSVGQFLNGLAVQGVITGLDVGGEFAQFDGGYAEITNPVTGQKYVAPIGTIPTGMPGAAAGGLTWPGA